MKSHAIKKGSAMLRPIEKPLMAVVHTYSDVSPCNLTLRNLTQNVREGMRSFFLISETLNTRFLKE